MTAAERLSGPLAKVTRAKQHIDGLESAVQRFVNTKPYDIRTEDNPQTGQYVKRVVRAEPIPREIPTIIGDILFNPRSALDHLAYQLVLVGTKQVALGEATAKKIYFPIGDSAAHYVTRRDTEIKGARQDVIDHIDTIQPYRGGKGDILWRLHKLNNADKHRLLVTTAVVPGKALVDTWNILKTAKETLGLPTLWAIQLAAKSGAVPIGRFEINKSAYIDSERSLKVGDRVGTGTLESKTYERVHFILQIALSEPGIVEGKPIMEPFKQMVDFVVTIMPTFEPFLSSVI